MKETFESNICLTIEFIRYIVVIKSETYVNISWRQGSANNAFAMFLMSPFLDSVLTLRRKKNVIVPSTSPLIVFFTFKQLVFIARYKSTLSLQETNRNTKAVDKIKLTFLMNI